MIFSKIEYSEANELVDIIKAGAKAAEKAGPEIKSAVMAATKGSEITVENLRNILPELSKIKEFRSGMVQGLKENTGVIKELGKSDPGLLKDIVKENPSSELIKNIASSNPDILKDLSKNMSGKELFNFSKDITDSKSLKSIFKDSESVEKLSRYVKDSGKGEGLLSAVKDARTGKVIKGLKTGATFCSRNKTSCALLATSGVATYVAEKYKHLKDEERECIGACLPKNWDNYKAKRDSNIEYQSLPLKNKDGSDISEFNSDNVCQSSEKDCDKFCEKACHQDTGILNLLGLKRVVNDTFNELLGLLNNIPQWVKILVGVLFAVLIIGGVVKIFKK